MTMIAIGAAVLLAQLDRRGAEEARASGRGPELERRDARLAEQTEESERRPVAIGDPQPASASLSAASRSAAAIAAIIEVGARLGPELDLVRPDPDPTVLATLRELVREGELTTDELRVTADAFERGDARRVALVLSAAWADSQGPVADAWLTALATDRAAPSVGAEQESLAAVVALDIADRQGALASTAAELVDASAGGDEEGFPGLTRVRTWHALAALDRFDGHGDELGRWIEGAANEHRIASELWALAVRTDPSRFAALAIDGGLAGDPGARAGIESLTESEHIDRLVPLLERNSDVADSVWVARSAARALIASADARGRAAVATSLAGAGELDRDLLLEALHTWREPAEPELAYASQLLLLGDLTDDDAARERVAHDLDRRFPLWLARRDDAAEERLRSILIHVESRVADDDLAFERLNAWREALTD